MSDNLRDSFRVWPEEELVAELLDGGRTYSCALVNLSAGGAKVEGAHVDLEIGSACVLRLRLSADLSGRTGASDLHLPVEVLERTETPDGSVYRMRSAPEPGSSEYEATAKLVFEAQRRQRARENGRNITSPMVSDQDRRRDQRPARRQRFGKGSLRPDGDT